ncbi:E3 ubiquitin-protein ligase PUB23 [Sesamum indicum]|uniref:U-box domain-containing protein n=1 Tax=Sesamum indicum TaxID=4182 RepID=A0A6I9U1D3_SESIN|nr:E3 ubiquitin-protein ligase PUB23 [Sesamum indicum]
MEEAYEVEIPCHFLCPISMQLMKDPVTVSTGITYDRESIEKWLFSRKNPTCPVTKQELFNTDLTPNHTLRRLIQAWCTLNAFERIPTPKPPVDRSQIVKLLNEAKNSPKSQLVCLQRLRSIARRNESGKNHLQAAGAVHFLLSVVRKNEDAFSRDEALSLLQEMELSDSDLKTFLSENGGILDSLIQVLETGDCQNRTVAMMLLKSAFYVADPADLIGSRPELFTHIVHILRDRISQQATKAALKLLVELCPWGRNRIKAVDAGAVAALIELLLETADRRACELVLTVLDQLCGCAEGRAELLRHGCGLAVVSKKILRVSHAASERGVRILSSISKYSANSWVLQEMLQVGVASKLCLVLQVEASLKTKERAKEILRLHSRVWRDSPCIPPHLLTSYPST